MIILWGFRPRRTTLSQGEFFCPRCGGDRQYVKQGVRRWFTLFFIPLFPISGQRNVHVVCTTCKGAFNEKVLDAPSGQARVDHERLAFAQCATAVFKAGDVTSEAARAALQRVLGARGIAPDLAEDASPDQMSVYVAPVAHQLTDEQREQFFGGCGIVALADGPLGDGETTALRVLGESLNLSAAHRAGVLQSVAPRSQDAESS